MFVLIISYLLHSVCKLKTKIFYKLIFPSSGCSEREQAVGSIAETGVVPPLNLDFNHKLVYKEELKLRYSSYYLLFLFAIFRQQPKITSCRQH